MVGRTALRWTAFLWAALIGPAIGFVTGQLTQGGLRMPIDPVALLLWLVLAALALAALGWWLRTRNQPSPVPVDAPAADPMPPDAPRVPDQQWGRDYKIAIGSAGIKSIVREGRMEEAYDVRSTSETAFEAYADFDRQQERIALANRAPGPGFLVLSDTLEARSALSEGLGNRPPGDVWSIREEWMPAVSHFVEESALNLRAAGTWPARLTADLSAGGHGVLGLYALSQAANEFPRADRHAHFIVPEGDVERIEATRLLDALRFGDLPMDLGSEPMPWRDRLPLALTLTVRDNRQGRDDLDEVAAHVAPALSARVRFETGTSENLSNLMRRLTKHGPHADAEPCPITFHYAEAAVPIARSAGGGSVDLSTLLPLADGTLRALRYGESVRRALDTEIARHLLLLTVPSNNWQDVQRVEEYVNERLEFAGPPDRRCIGVFFSGYRPDPANREEKIFAIRLGAVAGGWEAVYRGIHSTNHVIRALPVERTGRLGLDHKVSPTAAVARGPEGRLQ